MPPRQGLIRAEVAPEARLTASRRGHRPHCGARRLGSARAAAGRIIGLLVTHGALVGVRLDASRRHRLERLLVPEAARLTQSRWCPGFRGREFHSGTSATVCAGPAAAAAPRRPASRPVPCHVAALGARRSCFMSGLVGGGPRLLVVAHGSSARCRRLTRSGSAGRGPAGPPSDTTLGRAP